MIPSEVRVNFADGEPITTFLSFTMRESFVDPLGSLEFVCMPPPARLEEYRARLAKGQLVTILIDGVSQGGFLVQSRQTAVGRDGVALSFRCVSPLATPYEGSAGKLQSNGSMLPFTLSTQTDAPVSDVVLDVFEPFGFSAIVGSDVTNAGARAGKRISNPRGDIIVEALKQQEAKSQDGEAAYEFAARIFKRFGVVVHVGIDGELLLSAPDYDQDSIYSVHQTFGEIAPGDRFLSDPPLLIEDTNEGQFSQVIVRGVRRDTAGTSQSLHPVASVSADEFNATHPPYSSFVAPWKPLYHVDKNASDVARCRAVATLIMGTRAMNSYVITGSVDGLRSVGGSIWTPNTCVDVRIDAEGISGEKMWVLGIERSGSRDGGQHTRLTIIPSGNLRLGEIPSG